MSSIIRTAIKEDESGKTKELVCEVLNEILGLPGVAGAVLEAGRIKKWSLDDLCFGRNDPTIDDIPFMFLWNYIQGETK